jgi:large subunit ribosomal protein L23
MKSLILKPRLSEKSYTLSQQTNTYVFDVPNGFNRFQVADAVRDNFEVKVKSVRMAAVKGKSQKSYRRQGRVVHRGQRSNIRKAYVTLAEGDKLPIFAASEEAGSKPEENK